MKPQQQTVKATLFSPLTYSLFDRIYPYVYTEGVSFRVAIDGYDNDLISMIKTKSSVERATRSPIAEHVQQEHLTYESVHLRILCKIITDSPLHFEDQVNRALQEGLAMLRLDLGIVSNIVGNKYTVIFFAPTDAPLKKEQIFDLDTTHCKLTFEKQDVVAIDHMADSPFSGHPCYSSFGLDSYIGVPILVEGLPYGTLNFSSTAPRSTPFTEADRNFVRLMGRWIGTCLASDIQEKELQSYRTELENLVTERPNHSTG